MEDNIRMFFGAKGELFRKARMLRSNQTEAEKILSQYLRNNQIANLRFKRQHPIAHYVVDFYCHKAKLVIEVDGLYHLNNRQKTEDTNRTGLLNDLGLTVLRFADSEATKDIRKVLDTISKAITNSNITC